MGYEAMGAGAYPADEEARRLLLKRANMPEMHIMIDCTEYKLDVYLSQQAPERCCGEHYLNLKAVLGTEVNLEKTRNDFYDIKNLLGYTIIEKVTKFRTDEAIHIGFMCREGRHHSVAACRITFEVLKRQGYNTQEVQYLSQAKWEGGQSCCCECCDTNHAEKQWLYDMAESVWNVEH